MRLFAKPRYNVKQPFTSKLDTEDSEVTVPISDIPHRRSFVIIITIIFAWNP